MAESKPFALSRLVSACVDVARKAGVVIRRIQKTGNLGAKDKAQKSKSNVNEELLDPVTVADIESQKIIEYALQKTFPGITIVGEEGKLDPPDTIPALDTKLLESKYQASLPKMYDSVSPEDVSVWIDPIDGTKSFIMGNLDVVTTLIGISIRGNPTAGIVYYPFKSKIVWGVVGFGIRGDLKYLSSIPDRNRRKALIWFAEKEKLQLALKSIQKSIRTLETSGSAGNMILKVVQGEVDAYFQTANNKWDTCAPEAIIRSIGGNLTDFYGKQYRYHKDVEHRNSKGILATMFDHSTYLPFCGDEGHLSESSK